MPLLIIVLVMPFIILAWVIRFILNFHSMKTDKEMQKEIEKLKREAMIARPLQDYVANLKPKQVTRISFRIPFAGNSPPTLENISRFAALSIRSHSEEYFVRDTQGEVYGPASQTIVRQWIQENRIIPETMISNHQEGPWLPARQVRALQDAFRETQTTVSARFDHLQIK